MTISVLHVALGKKWRGGELQVYQTLSHLDFPVRPMLICQPNTVFAEKARKKRLPVFSVNARNNLDLVAVFKLMRLFRQHRPDIIHLHDSRSHSLGIIAHFLSQTKAPLVVTKRVSFNLSKSPFSRIKFNYAGIRRIIAISTPIYYEISKIVRNKEVLTVIPSGIDVKNLGSSDKESARDRLHKLVDLKNSDYMISCIAALSPEKGLDILIAAARIVCDQHTNARFVIFGEGKLKVRLLQLITESQLEDHIILIGFRNDLNALLPGFDLHVSTSRSEGLGTGILQAMAARLPVVATQVGGVTDIIIDKENGYLIKPEDPASVAEKISFLIKNPDESRSLVNASKKSIRKFDIQKTVKQIEALYIGIMKNGKGS